MLIVERATVYLLFCGFSSCRRPMIHAAKQLIPARQQTDNRQARQVGSIKAWPPLINPNGGRLF